MTGDFYGLPTRDVESKHLRLEYLAEAGPRIVRLFLAGSDRNLLAELPDMVLPTPLGDYSFRGGHRLWHAPEVMPRSYVPDESGLEIEDLTDGVRLLQPAEALTGIRKSVEVRLHADRPAATLRHQLRNEGVWPVELAPWAITQLPLGGVAILPQHVGPLDATGLLPNRHLVLWPYTRWQDPRLHLDDDYVLIQADSLLPPCKVGYLNRQGWIAYLRESVFFVKRFASRAEVSHVDFGCNVEFYCGDRFIEMETVAPLSRLEPGQVAEHVEEWEFHSGLDAPRTIEGVRAVIRAVGL
jgi:hypothetical protein